MLLSLGSVCIYVRFGFFWLALDKLRGCGAAMAAKAEASCAAACARARLVFRTHTFHHHHRHVGSTLSYFAYLRPFLIL